MADQRFRGTLLVLQNKTKRDPETYKDEFLSQLEHLKALCQTVNLAEQVHDDSQFLHVLTYICHVSHCYPEECQSIPDLLVSMIKSGHLSRDSRLTIVKCLILLRSKGLVSYEITHPLFFDLLLIRDKELRALILGHITSDIKRMNDSSSAIKQRNKRTGGAGGNAALRRKKEDSPAIANKRTQSFLFAIIEEDDSVQARNALYICIDLYRRNIWSDERTVEVISRACFSKHTQIIRVSLRFFLMQMPKHLLTGANDDQDSDDGGRDPGRKISKLKQKLKIKKKTQKRERVLKREVKQEGKRYDREAKMEQKLARLHIDPVKFLRDPQSFAERLLAKLSKTTERFEVRILYLNVIARVVAEHEVVVLSLYSYLERYMEPSQLHATQILALTAASIHRLIPPDVVEPLLKSIANHFINDRSDADSITIGLNTIREICKRQPLAMPEDLLQDLVEYKGQRGDRGVIMSARALLQLYRDVNPELLPMKLRGSAKTGEADKTIQAPKFGTQAPHFDIPGMDLLMQALGENELQEGATLEEEEGGSGSGSWHDVSQSSLSEFGEEEEDEEEDDGEAPQLIPFHPQGQTKENKTLTHDQLSLHNKKAAAEANPKGGPTKLFVSPKQQITKKKQPVKNDDGYDSDLWLEESNDDCEEQEPSAKRKRLEVVAEGSATGRQAVNNNARDKKERKQPIEEDIEEEEEEEEFTSDEEEEGSFEEEEAEDESETDGTSEEHEASDHGGNDVVLGAKNNKKPQQSNDTTHESGEHEAEADWVEDAIGKKVKAKGSPYAPSEDAAASNITASNITAGTSFSSSSRLLTDEELVKLRELQNMQQTDPKLFQKKKKEMLERIKKKQQLIHDTSGPVTTAAIESFTIRKRTVDKEDRLAKVLQSRKENGKFGERRKKRGKENATHTEKSKQGKLFQMVKRSFRVGSKLKQSVEEREERKKTMKKHDQKFRKKRGWKH